MKPKKILICGATGFIGRNMLEHFAKIGAQITAVWNQREPFPTIDNVTWVKADLCNQETVHELVKGHDILIQAAATTSGSKDIVSAPFLHVTDNAVMNSHLLRASYEHSISRFIFFSCSVMYPSSDTPVCEDGYTGHIEPKYFGAGWTKVYIERMCEFYAGLGRTKHTIIRHSNIYGPHDKFDLERSHVFGATVSKVMQAEQELVIWGDGSESRDLLHVDDLVNFVDLSLKHQKPKWALYNCGSGKAISVKNLVRKIIDSAGKNLRVRYDQTKPSIPFNLALDCTKAHSDIGWYPSIGLDDGISRTLNWWQANIDPLSLKAIAT